MNRLLLAAALAGAVSSAAAQTAAPIGPTGGPTAPCSAFGSAAGTCVQGNDARLGAGAVTGAIKSNGSNSFSQAAPADLASMGTGVAAALGNATNATGGPVTAVTGCTAYTVTDQSGGTGVSITSAVQTCQYGNMVIVYGTITYNSQADASNAKISLPVNVPNQNYAQVSASLSGIGGGAGSAVCIVPVKNTQTASLVKCSNGAAVTNANLSTLAGNFSLMYPAQ